MCSVKPSVFWHGTPFNAKHALQRLSHDLLETDSSSSSSDSDASLSPTQKTTHTNNVSVEGGERDQDRIPVDTLATSPGRQNNDFQNSYSKEMKKVWEEDRKDEACLASMEHQLAKKEQNLACIVADSARLHSQFCVAEQVNKIEELQNHLTNALQRANSAEEEVQRYDKEIRRLRDHLNCIQDEGCRIDSQLKGRVMLLQKEKEGAVEESRILLDQLSQKDREIIAKDEEIDNLKVALGNIDKCQEHHKKDFALLQSKHEINFQSQLKENNSLQAAKCALEIEVASLKEKCRGLEEERNKLLTQLQKEQSSEARVSVWDMPSEKVFTELLEHVKKLSIFVNRPESLADNDGSVKIVNGNTKIKHNSLFCDQSVQTSSERSSAEMPLQDNGWKSMQDAVSGTGTSLTSVELGHHYNATTFECIEGKTSKKAHGHHKCTTGYAVNTFQQKKLGTKTEAKQMGNFNHASPANTDLQGLQGIAKKRDTNKVTSEGKVDHEQSASTVWQVCNNLVNSLSEARNELLLLSGESSFPVSELMSKSEMPRVSSSRPSQGEIYPETELLSHPQKATLCSEKARGNLNLPNRKKRDCFSPKDVKQDVKEHFYQADAIVIEKKPIDQAANSTSIQGAQSSEFNGSENKDAGNKSKSKCHVAKKPAWI